MFFGPIIIYYMLLTHGVLNLQPSIHVVLETTIVTSLLLARKGEEVSGIINALVIKDMLGMGRNVQVCNNDFRFINHKCARTFFFTKILHAALSSIVKTKK